MKSIIVFISSIFIGQFALANSVEKKVWPNFDPSYFQQSYGGGRRVNKKFLKPQKVDEILKDARQEMGDENLEKALGVPALKSLDTYAKLDDRQIYANIYVAAAAAGAAVAVVEYLWDRFVGNGPKRKIITPDDYFDIIGPRNSGFGTYDTFRSKNEWNKEIAEKVSNGPTTNNPEALTPVIASAVVGAVAHKAMEYSMKAFFGTRTAPETIYNERSFDLREQYNN
ncbi:MAG: hypothetical protein ACXVCL_08035 [Bdellovibrio sp.]